MKTLVSWCIVILTTFVVNVPLETPHLTLADSKCFPLDFNYQTDGQEYTQLLVIPHLDALSAFESRKARVISTFSYRIYEFITCMWKIRKYLTVTDEIDYAKIQKSIKGNYARDVGETGPGIELSGIEAEKVVSLCRNITEDNIQVKVVLTRNCILKQIKDFANKQIDAEVFEY